MLGNRFVPFLSARNFFGVNCKDSPENFVDGEWHRDSINVRSEPRGTLGSRLGYSNLTTASIGTAVAWCGFSEFRVHSAGTTTKYYLGGASNGKTYKYESNAYTELSSGGDTTDGTDKRYSFFTLNNKCLILSKGDLPRAWTGTGSAATFATSVTADWGIEWQRYGWLHSTTDPRLMYYSPIDTPDGAYTTFLNFDDDGEELTGCAKQGDDLIVGKEHSLHRVQYRGTSPLFKKYQIPANIGPINFWTMKEIPGGRLIFLAPDFNFYLLSGDTLKSVGDNIQNYIRDGVNARLKYAVSGLLADRHQYWCSFTYTSGVTQNDRTVVMDWERPYSDIWGNVQYPWFIYSIGAACFAEVYVSGKNKLYHGGYTGKIYIDDSGTNDAGSAFNNLYKSGISSHGDVSLEKKYSNIEVAYENAGDWNLAVSFIVDQNAATEKIVNQSMLGGVGTFPLFDIAKFDEDSFASDSDAYVSREINRQGKTIQVSMGTTGLDEDWLIQHYVIHAKPLRRALRMRET